MERRSFLALLCVILMVAFLAFTYGKQVGHFEVVQAMHDRGLLSDDFVQLFPRWIRIGSKIWISSRVSDCTSLGVISQRRYLDCSPMHMPDASLC